MVGFTTNHGAQCNQGVKFTRVGQLRQRDAQLKRAWHRHNHDVLFINAEFAQFVQAGVELHFTDIFIEPGTNDADMQPFAIQVGSQGIGVHDRAPSC